MYVCGMLSCFPGGFHDGDDDDDDVDVVGECSVIVIVRDLNEHSDFVT